MVTPGFLYIISAPSGAGKTSLVNALIEQDPHIKVSISHTTRGMRVGEKQHENYHFVSPAEFKDMVNNNVFLEYAHVFGQHYGTSRLWIEEQQALGTDIILEIDWQGARQIRSKIPNTISIFILPPSEEELRARLTRRHTENPEVIEQRMQEAQQAISKYEEYDYLICNDKFEDALEDLKSIIRCHRLQLLPQKRILAECLKHLLKQS